MELACKCGVIHKDLTKIKFTIDPLNKKHLICNYCGKQIYIPTLSSKQYKKARINLLESWTTMKK